MRAAASLLAVLILAAAGSAVAQEKHLIDPTPPGSLNPEPLPPLQNPDAPSTPAKELFARKSTPFPGPPRSIGGYFDGCLAGAVPLPITGPTWQVMRLSRNRNWGNPQLVRFIERFANNAKRVGWNGLLIGDMSQPRGGPMLSDHKSHQVGLDVDIWFTEMPGHVQTLEEREFGLAVDVVAKDQLDVDPQVWTPTHTNLIRTAAHDPAVTRILVNAAIKKALCREAGADRAWPRCVPGMVTPSTFMSKSPVRRAVQIVSRSPHRSQATAAVTSSTSGSRNRRCIRRRPSRNRR
jgi:penicillin-insensitive murein DD-endopeptidase